MLDDFIAANRDRIIARAKARAGLRTPKPSIPELTHGIPVFLHQLGEALRLKSATGEIDHEQISASAGQHGHDLLRMGLSIRQVVHDYGDVCQVITELAVQEQTPISGEDFRTLNLCLDDAIAAAVTEYARQRECSIENHGTERLGFLAHELRNLLNTAMLSFDSIRTGQVAVGGSTSLVHSPTLLGLRDLIDRSLAEVRLDAGVEHSERISAADFVEEVEIAARLQAQSRGVQLSVAPVDRTLNIQGDRQILAAAVANLLQNAFKFTRKQGQVSLTVHATAERVLFDIEDECGGLPPGKAEDLFRPFEQRSFDRSGAGLGLTICRKAAKANAGEIHVCDLPGKGCIFTLDLPRVPPPPLSVVDAVAGWPKAGAQR
jgi:signal transduction histidine kinase